MPSPRYSYLPSYSDSRCCFCHGESGRPQQTRSYFLCLQQSTPHRLCENRAVIDWFRLLLGCLGRAGRHRRTGGSRSVPTRFLLLLRGVCHFNVRTEISGWLSNRRCERSCRIHPAAEAAGVLLAVYNSLNCQRANLRFATVRAYVEKSIGLSVWS